VIDCEEASELITAYVDGELHQDDAELLCDHLDQCPACREKLDFEREAKEIVKLHHMPKPGPERVRKRIVDDITNASANPGQVYLTSRGNVPLKLLIVPLILLLAVLWGVALLLRAAYPHGKPAAAGGPGIADAAPGDELAPEEITPKPF